MLAAERRNEILEILKGEGKVIVGELSRRYGVTEETIRRDLEKLEQEGAAERTYGGAVLKMNEREELPFLVRKRTNVEAKKRIAVKICDYINDGDRIMLDASTTALFIAKQLRPKKNITIITNSIEILLELSDMKEWKVLSTGGSLRPGALSLVGHQAERMIDDFHVDKVIMSCKGVDLLNGFSDSNEEDAGIKRRMLNAADYRIMAVDGAKFDQRAFTRIVGVNGIDMVATDAHLREEWQQKFKEYRIKIVQD